tara:strand:+ start:441 stop:1400 length:960 start_codon:yes stop_codon:yes gene_type:complete
MLIAAAMSFLFSGIETGVFSLNRLRIRQQMREGLNKEAHILFDNYREPERFFWTILLGNILANAAFVIAFILLLKERITNNLLFWTAFISGLFILFTFCDLLPKTLFGKFPNRLCLTVAKPFKIIQTILTPLVSFFYQILGNAFKNSASQPLASQLFRNRKELKILMEESNDSLSDQERFMISQVVHLNERALRQFAIPLNLAITASADTRISEIVKLCNKHRIARIPIWKFAGGQRKIIGITTLKTSLYRNDYDEKKPASDYIQPALFLPSDLKVEAALKRMQRSGNWLAIVTGKFQQEIGIVSLQDILKVIFSNKSA